MARKLLRRYLPTAAKVKDNPSLHFLGDLLHDPNLFHLNRHSVSVAFFVGTFIAFIPMPFQMPVAALAALWVRCNLPIAVALVWITNPLTMPAIYFATYQFGRWLLNAPPISFSMEASWEWVTNEFLLIWKPLLVGSLLTGLILGALAYTLSRLIWRWHVVQGWNKRKQRPRPVRDEPGKED